MTTIIDGSAGITFPSGSNPQAAPSKVLQVVQGTLLTATSTTSTSLVTTGLTASITPLFSTSKIAIFITAPCVTQTASNSLNSTIYRNSTNIAPSGAGTLVFSEIYSAAANLFGQVAMNFIDSPATTSSTAYTAYFFSGTGASVTFNVNSQVATIILMEIAA